MLPTQMARSATRPIDVPTPTPLPLARQQRELSPEDFLDASNVDVIRAHQALMQVVADNNLRLLQKMSFADFESFCLTHSDRRRCVARR